MTLAELLQQLPGARTVANARPWLEENVRENDHHGAEWQHV